jgi:hypothetical protein
MYRESIFWPLFWVFLSAAFAANGATGAPRFRKTSQKESDKKKRGLHIMPAARSLLLFVAFLENVFSASDKTKQLAR